jgi:fermentation-respiration switch protein FrsA (DUF1100 family)
MGRLLAFIVGTLVTLVVLLWLVQRRLIYLPFGDVPRPSQVGLQHAESVALATADGLTLNAWLVPAAGPPATGALIVFNGNAGNRAHRADLARRMSEQGYAVLLFDYRGYGGNKGVPTEEGLALDARAARRYLESRPGIDPQRIVYFGESLGAAVAVRLAVEQRPYAVVLRSPFTSLADAGRHHYPYLPVGWLLRDRFPSIERISRIGCPLLVIAAAQDSIVPTELSRRLFDAAREPKQLVIVQNVGHNDEALVAGPEIVAAVAGFLRAQNAER